MLQHCLALLLWAPSANAAAPENVLEAVGLALATDRAYDVAQRTALESALKVRFADYGMQVVTPQRKSSVAALLNVITEGSFDEQSPERIADVAFAAYQAMSRGASPDVVQGIALYGYRKNISGDLLAVWANGYRQLVANGVPEEIAADLVNLAMNRDLTGGDFDILKWALLSGVKNGNAAKPYAIFLFGRTVQGLARPGEIARDAADEFRRARAERRAPRLPPYAGSFRQALAPSAATPVAAPPRLGPTLPSLVATSRTYLGTPYVWGGTSHAGIDCSGLTSATYAENRITIPRVSRDQWRFGVSSDELREGDLVFFNTLGTGVSHVGMVVDAANRRFIQSSSSRGVIISDLDGKYYRPRYLGARRMTR